MSGGAAVTLIDEADDSHRTAGEAPSEGVRFDDKKGPCQSMFDDFIDQSNDSIDQSNDFIDQSNNFMDQANEFMD